MSNLWDYNKKELEKTEEGRIKILERMISFGVYLKDKEKIFLNLLYGENRLCFISKISF